MQLRERRPFGLQQLKTTGTRLAIELVRAVAAVADAIVHARTRHARHVTLVSACTRAVITGEEVLRAGGRLRLVRAVLAITVIVVHELDRNHFAAQRTFERSLTVNWVKSRLYNHDSG